MDQSTLPYFRDEDVFILGGGPSLKSFDVGRLEHRNVIGCNDAYTFGSSIVDILIFGDMRWWNAHNGTKEFLDFENPIVTNCQKLKNEDRIVCYTRETEGFHHEALGWNGNTGASAINLALVLGARRIFLLGFDMSKAKDHSTNWHNDQLARPTKRHYERYKATLEKNSTMITEKWPGVEVYNLNPASALKCFEKAVWQDFEFNQEYV